MKNDNGSKKECEKNIQILTNRGYHPSPCGYGDHQWLQKITFGDPYFYKAIITTEKSDSLVTGKTKDVWYMVYYKVEDTETSEWKLLHKERFKNVKALIASGHLI